MDGKYALDYGRNHQEYSHNHHGLELKQGLAGNIKSEVSPSEFFASLQCTIYLKDNQPWGHFPLFFNSLSPAAVSTKLTYSEHTSRKS